MVSAIILAAGESLRMGNQNKLLLPFHGKTIIETVVDNVLMTTAFETIVVVGHQAKQVKLILANRNVRFVENPHFQKGMTSSIHAGVKSVASQAAGFMICLSDMPFITPTDYNRLIDRFNDVSKNESRAIVLPISNGQRGNPVIFSAFYKKEILAHKGVTGCKDIVKAYPDKVTCFEMSTDHMLRDIDVKSDYQKLT